MRLYIIFLVLSLQLSHIFAYLPNPLELSLQTSPNLKGYECGNYFFTDEEVKEALSQAQLSIDKGYQYPQRYQSKLHSESRYEEYFIYPLRNGQQVLPHFKHTYTVFFVVLTRNSNKEEDVVARITLGDYTKCIRIDSTQIGLSYPVPEKANGYMCSHDFFADETIRQSLALAQTRHEENPKYPSPYPGKLYPKHRGHLMWPIMKGGNLYSYGKTLIGPYFLILNYERQFVDVVIKGYSNNYLRCIRSRKPPTAPASDPFSELFTPPPKSGYVCGKIFFDDTQLEENAAIVESEASNVNRGNYPVEYSGPPFNEQCLIWPILHDGKLFRKGPKGPYRLILKPNYKILNVAMSVKGRLKACERKTFIAKKNHDTSDYNCNEHYFSHQLLVLAAKEACRKLKTKKRTFFPAIYRGSGFETAGPYYTYPVFQNNIFGDKTRHAGLNRVVISANCEVVGALTSIKIGEFSPRRLVKCHRLTDGPLPSGFFGPNAEVVSESKIRH